MNKEKEKPKFPRLEALKVAEEIYELLKPYCHRVKIAGSLRRRRPMVSDVEVLFIPILERNQAELFAMGSSTIDLADHHLNKLVERGVITKRPNAKNHFTWGALNKLAVHVASGIPVDFFATTEENWINSLFVRTGGRELNLKVTVRAQKRGYSFQAYGSGFVKLSTGEVIPNTSEVDIFKFVGLKYLEPQFRP